MQVTCTKRSTFNVHGINETDHVAPLCSKTVDTVNLLRTVGFNGYGFATKVKKRLGWAGLYETFIPPRLEYGMLLMVVGTDPARCIVRNVQCDQND